jgi:predicted glycoside hydrolase/deacetylase ChbG (UPF0249 family)
MASEMSRKVIINADDFGLTRSVSDGIIQSCKSGLVRSTSVLSNMFQSDDIDALRWCDTLDYGIHLNLTVGQSFLPHAKIKSLTLESGEFHKRRSPERIVNDYGFVVFDDADPKEILDELTAQIEWFLSFNLKASHLDSHHHIHADEKVLAAVIELAKEYNLPVRSISDSMRNLLRAKGIPTNDHFEGGFFGSESITKDNLTTILRNLPDGVTEVMTHPGLVSDELRSVSGYCDERETELEVITDDALLEEVFSFGVELIGWKDLVL